MAGRALVLGGTGEGHRLSNRLGDLGVDVISSLAGRTTAPELPQGTVRIGGFGGALGLRRYLEQEQIAAVIDATHPFATQMTRHAIDACTAVRVAYLRLERPPWRAEAGDRWTEFATLDAALDGIAISLERVFAAVGKREITELGRFQSVGFVARSVERPSKLPENVTWVQGRGPFSLDAELELLESHGVEALLCRASGGSGGYAKLEAARQLGLPVFMIERPQAPSAETVETVEAACLWLGQLLGRRTCV